jgi:hypothetical protein
MPEDFIHPGPGGIAAMAGIVHHIESDGSHGDTEDGAKGHSCQPVHGYEEKREVEADGRGNQNGRFEIKFPVTRLAQVVFLKVLIDRFLEGVEESLVLVVESYLVHRLRPERFTLG